MLKFAGLPQTRLVCRGAGEEHAQLRLGIRPQCARFGQTSQRERGQAHTGADRVPQAGTDSLQFRHWKRGRRGAQTLPRPLHLCGVRLRPTADGDLVAIERATRIAHVLVHKPQGQQIVEGQPRRARAAQSRQRLGRFVRGQAQVNQPLGRIGGSCRAQRDPQGARFFQTRRRWLRGHVVAQILQGARVLARCCSQRRAGKARLLHAQFHRAVDPWPG